MAAEPQPDPNVNAMLLAQLSEVKGQLAVIMATITANNDAQNRRIDDLRHTVDTRMGNVETRLSTLEKNERGTAMRAAVASALSGSLAGAVVSAGLAVIKHG